MKTIREKLAQVFVCVFLIMTLLPTSAFAMEVPVSLTEQEIGGKMTIVKVYEVDPDVLPESLIEEDFKQDGYNYTLTGMVKDVVDVEKEKEITQEEVVTVKVSNEEKARLEAIKSFPAFIEYDQDGYKGKLYPVISSMENEITGKTKHSGNKTIQKSYTYQYNDDSLIPQTDNGYSLSNVTWAEGSYVANSAIPENYVATATYKKPYSYSTINGWNFKMTYVGDVTYKEADKVRYTLTYTGSKGFFGSIGETLGLGIGVALCMLLALIILMVIIFAVYKLVMYVKRLIV